MARDLRICFLGDSFVQGVGDPEYRGWVGRVLEATGLAVTGYNLGVRRDTSQDAARRCREEVAARVLPGADNRLVVSLGSNDAVEEDGAVRVAAPRTLENVAAILDEGARQGLSVLVVGPPPVADGGAAHLRRVLELGDGIAALCGERQIPFIPATRALAADETWTREALAGDGAHPGAAGYRALADLVLSAGWREWITGRP